MNFKKIANNKKLKRVAVAVALGLAVFLTGNKLLQATKPVPDPATYKEFQKELKAGEVESAILSGSDTFTYHTKDGKFYEVSNPSYGDFKKDLLEAGVDVEVQTSFDYTKLFSALTSMIIVAFCFVMIKSMRGKESDIIIHDSSSNTVTLADVAGLDGAKKEVQTIIDFLKHGKAYKEAGAKLPKGILFYGPPGTGKTLLAKAVAGEAGVKFIPTSAGDFSHKYVGVGGDRVRKLFKEAKENAPCIIFIDEIDALGARRGSDNSERRNTLNTLLSEMDGFEENSGVIVIAATNRLSDMDEALIRPGRFDSHVAIPLPASPAERKAVIDIYTKNKRFSDDVDFDLLAAQTTGMSPADIQVILNDAAISSVGHNGVITYKDIDNAMTKLVTKGHPRETARSGNEKRITAVHEAGHAYVGHVLGKTPTKVTIIPSTSGLGGATFFDGQEAVKLNSFRDLTNELSILYAGRAAEELLAEQKDEITTGAVNDIERATALIKDMVTKYGAAQVYGDGVPLALDSTTDKQYISDWMTELARKAYAKATEILENNWEKVIEVADKLYVDETLSQKEFLEVVKAASIADTCETVSGQTGNGADIKAEA